MKNDSKLARRWACDERTIARWRKARAPLSSATRMRAWLAGKKNIPPGTAALLHETRAAEETKLAAQEQNLPEGAASALKRLEEMEARAFSAFKRATETGDPISMKAAREGWLKISESLRRFDLALEQNRRESGELIPRAEVLRMVTSFGQAIFFAVQGLGDCTPSLVGLKEASAIYGVLRRSIDRIGETATAALKRSHPALPEWLVDAVAQSINPGCGPKQLSEDIAQLAVAIQAIITSYGEKAREHFDKLDAARKKWADEKDPKKKEQIWHDEIEPLGGA